MPVPNPHIDYEPWQVEILAQRLAAYHQHKALVSPSCSWFALVEEIIGSPVTRLVYDENEPDLEPGDKLDKHYPLKVEALRRFAQRISTVPQDLALLDDIKAFLISKDFLSPQDLEPHAAPYHLTCALAQAFGAHCFAAPAATVTRFNGDFLGRHEGACGITEILISMVAAPDGRSLQIREACLTFRRRPPEPMAHVRARVGRCEPCSVTSRDGVAMVTPKSGVMFGLCADDEDAAYAVPGGVFLLQKVAFDQDRVQGFDLVGQHHLLEGQEITVRRCDRAPALNRMRRIAAVRSEGWQPE